MAEEEPENIHPQSDISIIPHPDESFFDWSNRIDSIFKEWRQKRKSDDNETHGGSHENY